MVAAKLNIPHYVLDYERELNKQQTRNMANQFGLAIAEKPDSQDICFVPKVMLGLGAIIGTGVFVTTGIVAAQYSGPAVMLSYLIAGVTCIFVALAYTELATMLPDSGSIYTYSYVAFGEVFAWLMGSVIILELAFAAGVVAVGWSGYVQAILAAGG
ncbi:unnamed protein product, partial [Rotaria sordida]